MKAVLIEKEEIQNLKFPKSEVLSNSNEKAALLKKLKSATSLGNGSHNKVRIFFEDDTEIREVETTIWAVGDQNISLKYGLTIPISRIYDVVLV